MLSTLKRYSTGRSDACGVYCNVDASWLMLITHNRIMWQSVLCRSEIVSRRKDAASPLIAVRAASTLDGQLATRRNIWARWKLILLGVWWWISRCGGWLTQEWAVRYYYRCACRILYTRVSLVDAYTCTCMWTCTCMFICVIKYLCVINICCDSLCSMLTRALF